jgi:glycosyltransferase involved in cell wall biosynthesis
MKRVAVFVNALVNKGGVERIVLRLCQKYGADVFCAQYDPETTFEEFKKYNVTCRTRGKKAARKGVLGDIWWFWRVRVGVWDFLNDVFVPDWHDVYVNMGGIGPLITVLRHRPQVLYACMPIAWLYHRYDQELARKHWLVRPLWRVVCECLRVYDRFLTRRFDRVCVISNTTKENFRKYLGINSHVIYPPTDITGRKPTKGKYYLWVGRLTAMKRPGLVIEAFRQMPMLSLRVVGGGELFEELKRTAPANVTMVGPVSEDQLKREYDGCIAAVFVSTREDFGYVPIEAFASGKPCIAANAAGFTETIIQGRTGLLLDEPVSVDAVKEAVIVLNGPVARSMRKACLERATKFDDTAFFCEMSATLDLLCNPDYPPYEWQEPERDVFKRERCEDCGRRLLDIEDRVCKSCWSHERSQ